MPVRDRLCDWPDDGGTSGADHDPSTEVEALRQFPRAARRRPDHAATMLAHRPVRARGRTGGNAESTDSTDAEARRSEGNGDNKDTRMKLSEFAAQGGRSVNDANDT